MSSLLQAAAKEKVSQDEQFGIIDCDVHPYDFHSSRTSILGRLPQRWRDYASEYGLTRPGSPGGDRPRHREFSSRWDTEPLDNSIPMSNSEFAREQLLDKFDITAAMLNDIPGYLFNGARSTPRELAGEMCRAMNDEREEKWFSADERWHGSITTPYEAPEMAVREIQRRMDSPYRDQWRQVILAPDNLAPPGHKKYWPIYEICEEYGLPIGFHVLSSHRLTPSGTPNYYFEEHVDWAAQNFPLISSFIFEGVFERFPNLKIALIELGWTWAVPLAWRMDAAYRLMHTEVPHLERLPSEYLRDHVWYTTQPMEEPEEGRWVDDVLEMFEKSGMADKLMYSSDYPHWDFDEPNALPRNMSDGQRRSILGGNASSLYGIDLKPNSGVFKE